MFYEGSVISWWHPAIKWMSMFTVECRRTPGGGGLPVAGSWLGTRWQSVNLNKQFWQHWHKNKLHQTNQVYLYDLLFLPFCPRVHKRVSWSFSVYLFVEEGLLQNVEQEPDAFEFCLFADALYHKVWNRTHTHTFYFLDLYHILQLYVWCDVSKVMKEHVWEYSYHIPDYNNNNNK